MKDKEVHRDVSSTSSSSDHTRLSTPAAIAGVKRPQYFGKITNDIVYRRLAPGVLEELKRVTPRLISGRHKDKLFQRLTQNTGYPKLREHLGAVVTMMQLSTNWHDFMAKLDKLRPRLDLKSLGKARQLSFDYDSASDAGKGL